MPSLAERGLGTAADAALILVATLVVEEGVEAWLWNHHELLYLGTVLLHLLVFPVTLHVLLSPWSRASRLLLQAADTPEQKLLIWSGAIGACTSFIVPGVMALALDVELWSMLTAIFGPYALAGVWVALTIWLDQRSEHAWSREDVQPWRITLPAIAALLWGYLLFIETLLLVCVGEGEPWGDPLVVSMAVFAGYLPTRIQIWFLVPSSRLELFTGSLAALHLIYRVFAEAG